MLMCGWIKRQECGHYVNHIEEHQTAMGRAIIGIPRQMHAVLRRTEIET